MNQWEICRNNIDYITKSLAEKVSFKEMAQVLNCKPANVWQFAFKHKIPFTRKGIKRGSGEKLKPQILQMWNDGKSAYKIAQILNVSGEFILDHLKKWGIDPSINLPQRVADRKRGPNRIPVGQRKEEIIKLYNEGKTLGEIGRIMGAHGSQIGAVLKGCGIITKKPILYLYDENYLDKIDTPEKAYYLGLFYADGNVTKKYNAIKIQLAETDKLLLEQLIKNFSYNGKLLFCKRKNERSQNMWTFCISRRKAALQMTKLGAPPNKTFLIRFPGSDILPTHLIPWFVAGNIMGDGTIRTPNYQQKKFSVRISVASNYYFLKGMLSVLPVQLCEPYQASPSKGLYNGCHTISCSNKKDFLKLGNWLYSDEMMSQCNLLQFDRKCLKFRKYCQELKQLV